MPGDPCKQGISEGGARQPFIYQGFRAGRLEMPYPRGFQRGVSGNALLTPFAGSLMRAHRRPPDAVAD